MNIAVSLVDNSFPLVHLLSLKSTSARFPTSSDNDMTEPTHIIDTEGEVIIILKCPESPFAPWNEDMGDLQQLNSHGDVQKTDSGDNATQEAIHKKFTKKRLKKKNKRGNQTPVQPGMDESTDNPAETPEPAGTAMVSAAEIVDDSVTESANGPTTEALDEQL